MVNVPVPVRTPATNETAPRSIVVATRQLAYWVTELEGGSVFHDATDALSAERTCPTVGEADADTVTAPPLVRKPVATTVLLVSVIVAPVIVAFATVAPVAVTVPVTVGLLSVAVAQLPPAVIVGLLMDGEAMLTVPFRFVVPENVTVPPTANETVPLTVVEVLRVAFVSVGVAQDPPPVMVGFVIDGVLMDGEAILTVPFRFVVPEKVAVPPTENVTVPPAVVDPLREALVSEGVAHEPPPVIVGFVIEGVVIVGDAIETVPFRLVVPENVAVPLTLVVPVSEALVSDGLAHDPPPEIVGFVIVGVVMLGDAIETVPFRLVVPKNVTVPPTPVTPAIVAPLIVGDVKVLLVKV